LLLVFIADSVPLLHKPVPVIQGCLRPAEYITALRGLELTIAVGILNSDYSHLRCTFKACA